MELLFFNKNHCIAKMEYYEEADAIINIYEMYDIDHAPFVVSQAQYKKEQSIVKVLNRWYRERSIPSWRKGNCDLLNVYRDIQPQLILDKGHGASLSDQYWFKQENDPITWEKMNFFHHAFPFQKFYDVQLGSNQVKKGELDLASPNITTDGMLPKCWTIEDEKRVLVKGTFTEYCQEPLNEWLASQIAKRLGFDYVDYTVDWNGFELVSKCEDFIQDNEELVPAYDIFVSKKKPNDINDYEHYISILEEFGVFDARQNVANTFIVDYLTLNYDRHLKNFGVIRDVDTLKWKKVSPIYDTGQSMHCDRNESEMDFREGHCKFFNNTSKDLDDMLWTLGLNSLKDIDFCKLKGLDAEFEEILRTYQDKTKMSNARIEKLKMGFQLRVDRIQTEIEHMKKRKKE